MTVSKRCTLRILQIHTHYRSPGGEDRVVEAEADLLRAAGHDVETVIAQNPSSPVATTLRLASSPWNLQAARRVAAAAERVNPDVAHVHNTWFSLSPSVVSTLSKAGIPVVVTLHNFRLVCANGLLFREGAPCEDCVGKKPWRAVAYRCYRGSAPASAAAATTIALNTALETWTRHVDRFVVMTEFSAETFTRAGLPREKVLVKPHFVPDPGPRSSPPSASNTVVFVGRLTPEKGIPVLLEAWKRAALPDFRLLVVGDGPLAAQVAAAGGGVELLGHTPPEHVRRILLGARALVFPSIWYETFGLTMVEAMAAGTPPLGSDRGGTREILGPASAPFVLTPDDPAAWASGLETLRNDDLVDAAGRAARTRYEKRYTPDVGLRRLETLYRSVTRR